MKRLLRVAIIVGGISMVLPMTGCKTLLSVLNSAVQKPTMKFQRLALQNVSFSGLSTIFHFNVNNPNPVGMNLAKIAYALDIDGNQLFNGSQNKGLALKAQGTSPVQVPFAIKFDSFVKSLLPFFQSKSAIPYRLKTAFGIDTPVGIVTIPFDLKGNVPLPQLPKVEFAGANVGSVTPSGANLNFRVKLQSQGKFPVAIKALNYAMNISGVKIGGGSAKAPSALKVGGAEVINIPLKINFLQTGAAILQVIQSRKLPYDFSGNLNMGLFPLPFNLKGNVNL